VLAIGGGEYTPRVVVGGTGPFPAVVCVGVGAGRRHIALGLLAWCWWGGWRLALRGGGWCVFWVGVPGLWCAVGVRVRSWC